MEEQTRDACNEEQLNNSVQNETGAITPNSGKKHLRALSTSHQKYLNQFIRNSF